MFPALLRFWGNSKQNMDPERKKCGTYLKD